MLRAVAQGDTTALAALHDRHAGWLPARLNRRCADPEAVREVLQDTFVTAWRSAGSHRGAEAGGWLRVIAARRAWLGRHLARRTSRAASKVPVLCTPPPALSLQHEDRDAGGVVEVRPVLKPVGGPGREHNDAGQRGGGEREAAGADIEERQSWPERGAVRGARPMQPGPQAGAWTVALLAYGAGAALFAVRGARPEHG
ncbi:sigma factor [Streptomyces sp. ADI92-24]|uniref:RNA polymerase sigma factor n=1 Tax=Streptomyces sp. ADI92-24 TaxID=1522756 RepID=UPI001F14FDCE|nr:sigma factor [Streptomyces sp. ADI92-24]